MKINRPHISHKSDTNALRLNLGSEDQVIEAFRDLNKIGGQGTEVLLQPMSAQGYELILGGKKDAIFGHAVLFGLGGVFVELLDDVAWRVAPVSHEEARRMMDSISSIEALKGFRGRVPSDLEAVEDLLVRLSQLLMDFPMIKEVDINPIMVFDRGKGAQALDARVVLSDE
jgi:acyl-CoA synthetase (NDP forming)